MREKDLKEDLATLAYKAEADHEVQMARADLYKIAKYSIKLHEMMKGVTEEQGLEGWVQSKITKAADYMGSVYHHLDYEMKFDEMTEAKKAKPDFADIDGDGDEEESMKKAAQDKKEKGGDDKKDDSKGLSAKQKKLPAGLQKAIAKKNESYTDYLKDKLYNTRKYQTLEESVGKPITEEEFDILAEKQDACYHKVKSRYKVWPSAYASGALVQCRKKGAKNWGNSKK
tara:strand:+ start:710 stop:1393 length:684 start_codon:yes stop_codon:yes gene_type:complete